MSEDDIEALSTKEEIIDYMIMIIDNAESDIIHERSTNFKNDFDVLKKQLKSLREKLETIL